MNQPTTASIDLAQLGKTERLAKMFRDITAFHPGHFHQLMSFANSALEVCALARCSLTSGAPAPHSAAPSGELHIGMSNNDQGVHVNIMQRHADGIATVIFSARVPEGDSHARAALSAPSGGSAQASGAPAEPIYQAQFMGDPDTSDAWRDVTEAAYDAFPAERRRIVYATPIQATSRAPAADPVVMDCVKALSIGYVEIGHNGETHYCADCQVNLDDGDDHAPDCLVVRARAYLAAPVHDAAATSDEQALRPTDDQLWDQTITKRDMYHEWADKLAEAIAKHFGADIGEHSNQNCPWHEALEVIESADSASSGKSLAVAYDRFSAAVDRGMAGAAALSNLANMDNATARLANSAIQDAPSAEQARTQPELTVWYGDLPESNGKSNFTAILMRRGERLLDNMTDGITIDQSEYPDRVRYEADRVRYLIGEIAERPDILDYDADKHSGYVEPELASAAAKSEQDRRILLDTIRDLGEALLKTRDMVSHPDNVAFIDKAIAFAGIRPVASAVGAGSAQPAAQGEKAAAAKAASRAVAWLRPVERGEIPDWPWPHALVDENTHPGIAELLGAFPVYAEPRTAATSAGELLADHLTLQEVADWIDAHRALSPAQFRRFLNGDSVEVSQMQITTLANLFRADRTAAVGAAPAGSGADEAARDAKDAQRLDWLNQNFFSDQKDEWDERLSPNSIKWKFFGPMSVQGDVRRVIDAAMAAAQQDAKGERRADQT